MEDFKTPCNSSYAEYVSDARETHLKYKQLFSPVDSGSCPDLYKLGRIDTAPGLRSMQNLENQTLANVCICSSDKDVCSRKNMYPLYNASCTVPWKKDELKGCQTSYFNTKV